MPREFVPISMAGFQEKMQRVKVGFLTSRRSVSSRKGKGMKYLTVALVGLLGCIPIEQESEYTPSPVSLQPSSPPGTSAVKAQDGSPLVAMIEDKAIRETKQHKQEKSVWTSNWTYRSYQDESTGKAGRMLFAKSENSFRLNAPYRGEQQALLRIREHPRFGRDVILSIARGQITACGYYRNSLFVRFDDDGERWPCDRSGDSDSTVVFLRKTQTFIRRASKARVVVITATIYRQGDQSFRFKTDTLGRYLDRGKISPQKGR